MCPPLYCDNFVTCSNFTLYEEERARVGGWHIFHGRTIGGEQIDRCLCPGCVGSRARRETPPPVLDGQLELFE